MLASAVPRSALLAQTLAPTGQGAAGTQEEQVPTPRDPRYVPPLIPQSLREQFRLGEGQGGGADAALLLTPDGGGNLQELLAERRREQELADRRANRYGERRLQMLEEQDRQRDFLETMLLRQFGVGAFPRDFGQEDPYQESVAKRFTVITLLAMPFTTAFSFALLQGVRLSEGETGDPGPRESLGAVVVGLLGAMGIAWYDYSEYERLHGGHSGASGPATLPGLSAEERLRDLGHRRGAKGRLLPAGDEQSRASGGAPVASGAAGVPGGAFRALDVDRGSERSLRAAQQAMGRAADPAPARESARDAATEAWKTEWFRFDARF